MKMKDLFRAGTLFTAICLCLALTSCQEKPRPTQQETEQLKLTPEEAERLTPEMLEHRKASLLLSEYVVLKDQQYVLEISAREAMEKKGISQELYDKVVKDLESTNAAITKALQEGEELNFPNPKEILKNLREKLK